MGIASHRYRDCAASGGRGSVCPGPADAVPVNDYQYYWSGLIRTAVP